MIVRKEIELTQPLASFQVEILHNLQSRPVSPDKDCPELTTDQLTQFEGCVILNGSKTRVRS